MEIKPFIPYRPQRISEEESIRRVKEFCTIMNERRSCRNFSNKLVNKEIIDSIIQTASSAPSGAHKQPWIFCAISNPDLKKEIRRAAEKEEYESYNGRMPQDWLDDLAPLGTDWRKEFIEIAPWIIVVFKQNYGLDNAGNKKKHYYVNESVGLASGFLLAAIHQAGLVALTHTPSPMDFLSNLLGRPKNEKPILLVPIGYPAKDCMVPNIERKPLSEVAVFYE